MIEDLDEKRLEEFLKLLDHHQQEIELKKKENCLKKLEESNEMVKNQQAQNEEEKKN